LAEIINKIRFILKIRRIRGSDRPTHEVQHLLHQLLLLEQVLVPLLG